MVLTEFAIEGVRYNLAFSGEDLEYQVVYGFLPVHVVDVDRVLLADTMGTILCLRHNGGGPKELSKDYSRGGCQSKPLAASSDT